MTRHSALVATPEQVDQAQRVLGERPGTEEALLGNTSTGARPLPKELADVLDAVLQVLAGGGSFAIEVMPEMLTTTQAARLLGESRPTLMKRISSGELTATMVGAHHRVRTADVLALREAQKQKSRKAVRDVLELEDELGL